MERTFKFPKGCSVGSITMRETTGKDEENAIRQAELKGSVTFYPNELLRCAIVKVDGAAAGLVDLESWNSRTRLFAKAAFNKMNSAEDSELTGFLGAADEPPAAS